MGPSQQFLRLHLLEHHSQRVRSQPTLGAWGPKKKQKDCKQDSVSMQQLQYLTIQQGTNFIPGGFDYMRFPFAHYPTTPRDQRQSFGQLHGWSGGVVLAFPSDSLSTRGLSLSVVSSLG
jgi:hypothetical protein